MLFCVITGPTYALAHMQIEKALPYVDGVELRVDFFDDIDIVFSLVKKFSLPMIFTFKKEVLKNNFQNIFALLQLNPMYVDFPYDTPKWIVEECKKHFLKICFIGSYHDFSKTPKNLEEVFSKIPKYFDLYKFVTYANSIVDSLRMLEFVKTRKNIIGLCMGKLGSITRILAPVFNLPINYTCIDDKTKTAPGQIDCKTLQELYHYSYLDKETKIFGLIGDPIEKSISPILHNGAFSRLKKNGVYVKFPLKEKEVKDFFSYLRKFPFKGLSVTMPLKEKVFPYLDQVNVYAKKVGAINTIDIQEQSVIGYNTDGKGALDAIEKRVSVEGKTILILGAGGSSRAIAYEAHTRGGKVIICNRTEKKAKDLAEKIGCFGYGLDSVNAIVQKGYDIIISTIPDFDSLQINKDIFLPKTVAMDIAYGDGDTSFLSAAKNCDCICIDGKEMLINQANLQLKIWFSL